MELAMIGLGKMGGGMARRLLGAGHRVVAYSKSGTSAKRLADEAGAVATGSLEEVTAALPAPRVVWLMLPHGAPTVDVFEELGAVLDPGDLIVDGGNSHYKETLARASAFDDRRIALVDVGTSGGVWGESEGYCLMVGGAPWGVERIRPALDALAAPDGWSHVGSSGAGHFVKMVHNGIEYGLMQAYAEGFAIMRAKVELGMDLGRVAELWRHGSVIRSWLLDLVVRAMEEDPDLGSASPIVEDSGEGRWTVEEAIELGVSTPVIADALLERFASRESGHAGDFTGRFLTALRHEFGGHSLGGSGGRGPAGTRSKGPRPGSRKGSPQSPDDRSAKSAAKGSGKSSPGGSPGDPAGAA